MKLAITLPLAVAMLTSSARTHASTNLSVEDATGKITAAASLYQQPECVETLKPDRLVISGGASAESVRPKDGSDQLDKTLAAMRTYVQSKNGKLIERERLRAARNAEQERNRDNTPRMPFMQVQRFEAEFPVNADVDEALERLLKLGMDRYGKDAGLDAHQGRDYKQLTSYRFTTLDESLRGALAACVREAARSTCGAGRAQACVDGAKVLSAYAQTETVATRDGYRRTLNLRVPGVGGSSGESDALEPLSANPVRVRLVISVTFPPAPVKASQ
jgi:hypothetical protein